MTTILIVDDESALLAVMSEILSQEGWRTLCAENLATGLDIAAAENIDIVLLDIKLPDGSGLDATPAFMNMPGSPEIIIMTGYGYPDAAGLALEYGVWDYLEKPLKNAKIRLSIKRAMEFRQAKKSSGKSRILKRQGIVGNSSAIHRCLEQISEAAEGDHSTLVLGETGTGKELFARAIHQNSRQAEKNFVVVDCTALNESLLGSSLFGHVKGSFTDASQDRDGLIKLAHQGTLFLDEVGEMPLDIQKKLLRVLEEKQFRPIGSTKVIKSEFRLISATNRNLDQMVEKGLFRRDLFYRINAQALALPPLRTRKEDIPDLTHYYIDKICKRAKLTLKIMHPEFMQHLIDYDWPGNVRELINVLDQAVCSAKDVSALFHKHLPVNIRSAIIMEQTTPGKNNLPVSPETQMQPLHFTDRDITDWKTYRKAVMDDVEKRYVEKLCATTRGNIEQAAQIAGVSQSRIYGLLNKHNISPVK